MRSPFFKELPCLIIAALPAIFAAFLWNKTPDLVPVHWNLSGEMDGTGSKDTIFLVASILPAVVYLLLLILPDLETKGFFKDMGIWYQTFKGIILSSFAVMGLVMIYSAKNQSLFHFDLLVPFLGILFLILGLVMRNIPSNHLLGFRTPWTLKNETVWKETHNLASKIWFVGGLAIIFGSLLLRKDQALMLVLLFTFIMILVPVLYSRSQFNKTNHPA
ncbi:MAG: SdpI family protein [Bacteroidia bacterium]|nr:SdpI family protein [Bacteroidia bacterium]